MVVLWVQSHRHCCREIGSLKQANEPLIPTIQILERLDDFLP